MSNETRGLYRADAMATSLGAGTASSVACRVIGLGRGVALAWLLTPSQFGLLGVALLLANVFTPICAAGLYEGIARYAPKHEVAGALRAFVTRAGLVVVVVAVSVGGALILLGSAQLGPIFFVAEQVTSGEGPAVPNSAVGASSSVTLTQLVLVCAIALAVYQSMLGLFQGLRMFRVRAVAELLAAILFTLIAVTLAWQRSATASTVMFSYAAASVVAVLALAPGLVSRAFSMAGQDSPLAAGSVKALMKYSGWMAGTALVWHALCYYPMWYLLKVSGPEAVAPFHAARMVAQLLQVGAAVLIAVVTATVTRTWEQRGRDEAADELNVLTKAALVVFLVGGTLLLLAKPLVLGMFPEALAVGNSAYAPLLLFFLLAGVLSVLSIRLTLVEKPGLVLVAWLAGAFVNVVVSYALIQSNDDASSPTSVIGLAAWSSVAGIAMAVAVCLLLIHLQGLGVCGRCWVLMAAALAVGFGWPFALPVAIVIVALALRTTTLFSHEERSR
ncbi:MAG: oligosaccharide flippase family protein, partial [Planctomycetes bacterium]|nr:oligosaccharide flippase family protein [Planctomycetota bacterium]